MFFEGFIILASMSNLCAFPHLNIFHVHVGENDTSLGKTWFLLLAKMHIKISLWPRTLIVFITIPRCAIVIAIEIVVLIGNNIIFEIQIHGETTYCLRDRMNAISKSRTYELRINEFESSLWMSIRNHIVTWKDVVAIHFNASGMSFITNNLCNFTISNYVPTIFLNSATH